MKHIKYIAPCVIALGFAGALALRNAGTPPSVTRASASAAAPVSPSPQQTLASTVLQAQALELVYAVDFETKFAGNQQVPRSIVGSMTWRLRPVTGGNGTARFAASTSDASIVFDRESDDGQQDPAKAILADLQEPFGIELEPAGKVARLGVSVRGTGVGKALLKNLVGMLQLVRPQAGKTTSWTANEKDHLGELTAQYTELAPGSIRKTKRYSKTTLPGVLSVGASAPQVEADLTYALDALHTVLPSRAELRERITSAAFTSSAVASLELKSELKSGYLGDDALAGLRWITLDEALAATEDPVKQAARKRQMLGGADLKQVLSELQSTPRSGKDSSKRHALLLKLSALFDIDPTAIDDARRLLREGKAGAETAALLGALSGSDSAEARNTLTELGKDDSLPTDLREDAIANLSLSSAPTPKTFNDLRELTASPVEAVRGSAVLALGASARNGAQGPETQQLAEQATQELARRERSAGTTDDKVLYLNGLGNAGGQTALDSATAALEDERPDVRAAAVSALRFGPAPLADELIAKVWTKDPVADVRDAATFAASFRPVSPQLLGAALSVVKTDEQPRVRLGLVTYLAEHVDDAPAVRAALAAVAGTDANQDVKEAAARAIAQPAAEQ
jgi:hypothetical protein